MRVVVVATLQAGVVFDAQSDRRMPVMLDKCRYMHTSMQSALMVAGKCGECCARVYRYLHPRMTDTHSTHAASELPPIHYDACTDSCSAIFYDSRRHEAAAPMHKVMRLHE